jgi:anaerobic ribonucleoside-triphosphate reductase
MTRDTNAESWGGVKRTACEVFSRVCGYLRPVNRWNKGKQEEFKNRKEFQFKSEK